MVKVTLNELLDKTLADFNTLKAQYRALCEEISPAIKHGAQQAFNRYPDAISEYFEQKALSVDHPIRDVVTIDNDHLSDMPKALKKTLKEFTDFSEYQLFHEWCVLRQAATCDIAYEACLSNTSFHFQDTYVIGFKNPEEVGLIFEVNFHENEGNTNQVIIKNERGAFVPIEVEIPLATKGIMQPIFYKLIDELYRKPQFFENHFKRESDTASAVYDRTVDLDHRQKLSLAKILLLKHINDTFLTGDTIDENSHEAISEFYNDIHSMRVERLASELTRFGSNQHVDKDDILSRIHALNTFMDKVCDDNMYHHNSFNFIDIHLDKLTGSEYFQFLDELEATFNHCVKNHGTYGTLLNQTADERLERRMALEISNNIEQAINLSTDIEKALAEMNSASSMTHSNDKAHERDDEQSLSLHNSL
ncbi:hypothetical protein [Shewanella aestuarii]|uniref:Uncharacterized protein n=1 Tax=Shewanella aestuarii TaxID=1028752 RepID=A0A6G9QS12_9GAMM|nr:hypothetical protein [Shewanella aestuarii]QIR16571.1 hypothetical protein HBH39_19035 [Shewanella aestuarii]